MPIALAMKYGALRWASFLVLWHDFLDHLDGVVAKQQARDGRSTGDDGAFGAFLDAQMDKLVFCVVLWSFLLLCAWPLKDVVATAVTGTLTSVASAASIASPRSPATRPPKSGAAAPSVG